MSCGGRKQYRRGFLLGKFLPPHAGHLHLVRAGLAACDELTVLVCTLPDDSISGERRAAWMRELCVGARVIHVTDEVPSHPDDDPNFWPIWLDLFDRYCGEVDVVFSSEPYGDEIARRLGIAHVMVDRNRQAVPTSGSAILRDPIGEWQYVPVSQIAW